MMQLLALVLVGTTLALATGCGDDGGQDDFSATIVRTTFGIPHVTADDFGGLGFGIGYAYAQDNFCVLMREIIRANGQTAAAWGEEDGDLAEDYVYTFINTDEYIETEFKATQTERVQAAIRGYAAGLTKYLEDTGIDNLPEGAEGCRGEDWVRPIADLDIYKVYRKLLVRAGTGPLAPLIDAVEAPVQSMASLAPPVVHQSEPFDTSAIALPEPEEMGSNMYAIGSEASQTGFGILLGNPHFPWSGPLRWYISHLRIPGELDVMGASLHGVALINIGFNQNMAWSHTVSTGQRFTFYEVEAVPSDPMKYFYDGEERDIVANPVTIQVRLPDGTLEERTKNIYTTQYGPVINLAPLSELAGGWPTATGTLFTFRDANIDNDRAINQFLALNLAQSVDDVEASLDEFVALPWVNTTATDRDGNAFYGDVTTVPHVTAEKLEECSDRFISNILTNQNGIPSLDGSRSECEWGTDPDAPAPGIFGPSNLPTLRNRTYVANANDSYWLTNPDTLLTGFSPLIGQEGVQQSLRTRQTFVQAEQRLAGTDGLDPTPGFTVGLLQDIMYGNRNLAAELALIDVLAICGGVDDWSGGDCNPDPDSTEVIPYSQNPVQAAEACAILGEWIGLFNNESVGPILWNELWRRIEGRDDLWAIPFDATDPVNTPRDLNDGDPGLVEAVKCALGAGVDFLIDGGVAIDAPWGNVQFRWDGEDRIPIHGGSGRFMFSVIGSSFVEGEGYSQINNGNSYIQTVTFDDTECPDAFAVLTYSQSTDPSSPHFADMTRLYSEKGWNDMPFCEADIEAAKISEMTVTN